MGTAVLRYHDHFAHIDSFGSRTPPPPSMKPRRKALKSTAKSPPPPPLRRSPASVPLPVRSSRPSPAPPRSTAAGRRVTFSDKENGAGNTMVVRLPTRDIVMEKVKILKRGEAPAPENSRFDGVSVSDSVPVAVSPSVSAPASPLTAVSRSVSLPVSPSPAVSRSIPVSASSPVTDSHSVSASKPVSSSHRSVSVSDSKPVPFRRSTNTVSVSGSDRSTVTVSRSGNGAVSVSLSSSPLFSTNRLGPDPEILPKQIGFSDPKSALTSPLTSSNTNLTVDGAISPLLSKSVSKLTGFSTPPVHKKSLKKTGFRSPVPVAYAGPGYINSPSPSSVPFPASFMNNKVASEDAAVRAMEGYLRGLLKLGE